MVIFLLIFKCDRLDIWFLGRIPFSPGRPIQFGIYAMDVRVTTVGSTRFLTNPNDIFIGKSLEVYGEWSHGEVNLLSKLLRPDDNVIEIGSNIGAHTLFIARDICSSGIVYAFEPRRLLFQMLCANVALNGLTNVFRSPKGNWPGGGFCEGGSTANGIDG